MGLFSRKTLSWNLPPDILAKLDQFGRFEINRINPDSNTVNDFDAWHEILSPLSAFAGADPVGFAEALAAVALPRGGLIVYAAMRVIDELVNHEFESPAYDDIRAAALEFLRSRGVPANWLSIAERQFWLRAHGQNEPWIIGRPPPSPQDASIPPLQNGELRYVAEVRIAAGSNFVYVQTRSAHEYVAVLDMRQSDEDPTRARRDWLTADSHHALYVQIGEAFVTPKHWVADELAPFIPLPRPQI